MGNQKSVRSHIQTAEKTGVFQLSKAGIVELPKELVRLNKNCRSLDLSQNRIKVIPEELGTFIQLKNLNFNQNAIKSVPGELGQLVKLETLVLSRNLLTTIPDSFETLSNLKNLNLSENKLTAIPLAIAKLPKLDVLDLSKNKITEIPEGIGGCKAMEINLNQNQLSLINQSIADCPRLRVLRIEENCLNAQSIPARLLKDSPCSLIAIEGNLFELKDLQSLDGYEQYIERYTATKKKIF